MRSEKLDGGRADGESTISVKVCTGVFLMGFNQVNILVCVCVCVCVKEC